jgi:DNA-binding NarL/FixJ family response regulator
MESDISDFVGVDKWTESAVSVLVCDDVAYWRRRLTAALEVSPWIEVMAEVDDGDRLVEVVAESAPDVVWLGLHLPGPAGPRLIAAVREVVPSARVVVVANPDEEELRLRALRAGAVGIVGRAGAAQVAAGVTERVAWGQCVLEAPDLAGLLETYAGFRRQAASLQQQLEPPTIDDRDRAVLSRLASGATTGEVGAELGLEASTVSQVVAQAVTRLHRYARTDTVVYAVGEQLFDAG